MKKSAFIIILRLLILPAILLASIEAFSESTKVVINQSNAEQGRPKVRTLFEPVICIADKDGGYVEINFSINLGTVLIQLTNSDGELVDEVSLDTSIENFAILSIDDPDDSYTLTIESDQYYGEGFIN
jgi:hypothetical protein